MPQPIKRARTLTTLGPVGSSVQVKQAQHANLRTPSHKATRKPLHILIPLNINALTVPRVCSFASSIVVPTNKPRRRAFTHTTGGCTMQWRNHHFISYTSEDNKNTWMVYVNGKRIGLQHQNFQQMAGAQLRYMGSRPGFGTNGLGGYLDELIWWCVKCLDVPGWLKIRTPLPLLLPLTLSFRPHTISYCYTGTRVPGSQHVCQHWSEHIHCVWFL